VRGAGLTELNNVETMTRSKSWTLWVHRNKSSNKTKENYFIPVHF